MVSGAFIKFKELSLYFMKNKVKNITVYDGINDCKWNGGRINRSIFYKQSQIDFYYNRNINIALTFSNPIINLDDKLGNELLEKFHKKGNCIILINDNLRNYIRKNFPLYKLIYSITGTGHLPIPLIDNKFYIDLETKYDLIVPRMEHIFDKEFLKLNQAKYEIMLNDNCIWNCPLYKEHFEAIAKCNTDNNLYFEKMDVEECWLPFDPDISSKHDCMDITKIKRDELISRGILNFKISGRELNTIQFNDELELLKVKYDN
jgi:hypothetical protein